MEGHSSPALAQLETGILLHRAGLAGMRAPLPAPGLSQAVLEQAPTWLPVNPRSPQPHGSMSPHSPTHQHRQPLVPRAVLAAEGGSRWTGRQTGRQAGRHWRIPRLYCKIIFSWQLQLSRRRLSVPQTLPSPVQGLQGGAKASQGEKHPEPSRSRRGVAVMGGTAPVGWGARGQEGTPAALRWSGRVGSPVPRCCWPPRRAAGFLGCGSCAGSSPRRPHTPRPAPRAPSCRGRAAGR